MLRSNAVPADTVVNGPDATTEIGFPWRLASPSSFAVSVRDSSPERTFCTFEPSVCASRLRACAEVVFEDDPPHAATPIAARTETKTSATRRKGRCNRARLTLTGGPDSTMPGVRPLLTAGCAVVLLGLCGVAGASATNRPDPEARVPYTASELILVGAALRAAPLGTDLGAHRADATPAPTTPTAPPPGAPAASGLSFPRAVAALAARGELSSATAAADTAAWTSAAHAARHLGGTRRAELRAVLGTIAAIAETGKLTPSRLPALVLTLQRNQQWWTSAPMIAADQRVGFPGSSLVWEYYPGQGLEIQWLGMFGAANGFYDDHQSANLAALISQALSLAVTRGGGIAWEYDFTFDGGSPPWVSAITEGTAVEALTNAAKLLGDSTYLSDAHAALGIFSARAPVGVELPTRAGAWLSDLQLRATRGGDQRSSRR